MKRRSRRDGGRPVHRGLLIAMFLLMGFWFVARAVEMAVVERMIARDGQLADAVVQSYHHTPYAGAIGRVYISEPVRRDAAALAMRPHEQGEWIKVRYVFDDRLLVAESGAPLNTDAMIVWLILGMAFLGFSGWATRALYREQREWERLEAELLAR